MPYIKHEERVWLSKTSDTYAEALVHATPEKTAGIVNFLITKLMRAVVQHLGESYATYNLLIGALECAKLELYRRKIGPYEDAAIIKNGDV